MKRYFLLFVLIVSGVIIWQRVPFVKAYYERWVNFSFCDEPITYTVSQIDPEFELSEEKVKKEVIEAAEIWNEIAGWDLFQYDPNSELDINLIYDERQQSISTISKKTAEIEAEKTKYEAELAVYEAEKARVENRLDELNEEIRYWNEKGGAPIDIYKGLTSEQNKIQQEIEKINETTKLVNNTTDKINSEVVNINNKVNDFNKLLNTLPEEGLYIGGEERIEIYIYENPESFIHTVAHELGHALGLDHVEEKDAILYPISSPNSDITQSDIDAFENYCARQDRLELIKNDLKTVWQMLFLQIQNMLPLNT